MKKSIISILILGTMILSSVAANATTRPKNWENKWWCDGTNWTYIVNNKPVTGFQVINTKLYYFNADGNLAIGWTQIGTEWIYCSSEKEELAKGWNVVNGKWYYFDANGYMVHNTTVDGYTIGSDGAWIR